MAANRDASASRTAIYVSTHGDGMASIKNQLGASQSYSEQNDLPVDGE